MKANFLFLLATTALLTSNLSAQTNVPPGEQRLNRFQYHATHNSYERDNCGGGVSIIEQLDRYDVWMLEFDLRWKTTASFNDFWILHHCAEPCNQGPFDDFLAQIAQSHRATYGLTVIYFDSGDISGCSSWPNVVSKPSNWQELLAAKLTGALGNRCYTYADSTNDLRSLPSAQELLRRGKNFIPVVNASQSDFFFDLNSYDRNFVWINEGAETRPVSLTNDLRDAYTARHYPSGGWLCSNGDQGWEWAVTNGYTFPASNCSDKSGSPYSVYLHPPLPTYVNPAQPQAGRGTWLEPHGGPNALRAAIQRAALHESLKGPSMIGIQIAGGLHSIESRTDTALRLVPQAGSGLVRITR